MPLNRNEIQIDALVLEAEPFEWPRNAWEVLELRFTVETGWRDLTEANVAALRALYNGAQGRVDRGIAGLIVQYVEDTGGPAVAVEDWRGNTATMAFLPGTGLELEEIPGTAESGSGHYRGTIRLAEVA